MKKFRTCVIGVGFIGAVHVEALRRLGNVEVVALADQFGAEEKAKSLCVPKAYSDYKEMLDIEKPDVVHICVPNNLHYEMAMYAMEHGVVPVCEKPLTTTVEEAYNLVKYAEEHNIVTGMNFNCRFYPQIMQMHEMFTHGQVGDLFSVTGSYLQDWLMLDTDYSWRLEPDKSGESRAFADIGSHWTDMAEFVTGKKVTEVFAEFATFHKTRKKPLKPVATYSGMALRPEDYQEVPINTEDYATVLFHFDDGASGTCTVHQAYGGRKNQIILKVAGSNCAMEWNSEDSNNLWIGYRGRFNETAVKDPSILFPETAAVTSYPGGHVEGFPDTFKQNFKAIYKAIEEGDTSKHACARFEDGLREMLICTAVIKSAREKRWVKIGE